MKKYIKLITILLILNSCVTTNTSSSKPPLWFSDPSLFYSENKVIVFISKGESLEVAENLIEEQSAYLSQYITPTKEKHFIDKSNNNYLLYTIKKSELKSIFDNKLEYLNNEIEKQIRTGDRASNILDKYSEYKLGLTFIRHVEDIINIAVKEDIKVINNMSISLLNQKIAAVSNELIFTVNFKGDIDGILKTEVESTLHQLGYGTSENSSIIIRGELILKEANLKNDYINKYWTLNLYLEDYYGDSKKSVTFKGRDSQLSEEGLNQLILDSATKKIRESLKQLLP